MSVFKKPNKTTKKHFEVGFLGGFFGGFYWAGFFRQVFFIANPDAIHTTDLY
jgi:hypothetical protein